MITKKLLMLAFRLNAKARKGDADIYRNISSLRTSNSGNFNRLLLLYNKWFA